MYVYLTQALELHRTGKLTDVGLTAPTEYDSQGRPIEFGLSLHGLQRRVFAWFEERNTDFSWGHRMPKGWQDARETIRVQLIIYVPHQLVSAFTQEFEND